MKIPTDLQAGDIFHTNKRGAMTFTRYVEWNGEKWALSLIASLRACSIPFLFSI